MLKIWWIWKIEISSEELVDRHHNSPLPTWPWGFLLGTGGVSCVVVNYFQQMTLESWYTNLEETSLNRCQQLLALHKRLIQDENETDKWTSNRPTYLTNNRQTETNQWLITNLTRVFQPIHGLTYQLLYLLTNTIYLTLKMTSPQVYEKSVTNNSSFLDSA